MQQYEQSRQPLDSHIRMPPMCLSYLALAMLLCRVAAGQYVEPPPYKVWIVTSQVPNAQRLLSFTTLDSSLIVSSASFLVDGQMHSVTDHVLPITDVVMVKARRSGAVGRTLAVAAPAAMLIGLIAGVTGQDRSRSIYGSYAEFNAGTAIAVSAAGIGIGLLIGSSKKTVRIDGRQRRYELVRAQLRAWEVPR